MFGRQPPCWGDRILSSYIELWVSIMNDDDYLELRARLLAHQVLLSAILASHPDKNRLSEAISTVLDQAQSQILPSRLDEKTIGAFDSEISLILKKSGIDSAKD